MASHCPELNKKEQTKACPGQEEFDSYWYLSEGQP